MAKQESAIVVQIADEVLMNQIYYIRGQKVMLDEDLAQLYGVETRRLNEQVKRNVERFPEDFMFQLSTAEFDILKSQFATSSWGGRRKLPYAFTEHGVLMLSSVLSSVRAVAMNIQIMRLFARLRQALGDNTELQLQIEKLLRKTDNHDKNIELLFTYVAELSEKQEQAPLPRIPVGFKLKKGKDQ